MKHISFSKIPFEVSCKVRLPSKAPNPAERQSTNKNNLFFRAWRYINPCIKFVIKLGMIKTLLRSERHKSWSLVAQLLKERLCQLLLLISRQVKMRAQRLWWFVNQWKSSFYCRKSLLSLQYTVIIFYQKSWVIWNLLVKFGKIWPVNCRLEW